MRSPSVKSVGRANWNRLSSFRPVLVLRKHSRRYWLRRESDLAGLKIRKHSQVRIILFRNCWMKMSVGGLPIKGRAMFGTSRVFDDATNRCCLRILNSLFLMLSMGGFWPTLKGKDAEEPGVTVGNYHVSFKPEKLHQRARSNLGKAGRQKEPLQFEISNWDRRLRSFPGNVGRIATLNHSNMIFPK